MNLITKDEIDFSFYMRETESAQKVRPASQYVQELIDELGKETRTDRIFMPWEKTHANFNFRPGEVTLWGGVNGQGKSLITGLVAMSLMTQGQKTCIASFEMKPKRTLERMARQYATFNSNGDLATHPEAIQIFRDIYREFQEFVDKRLWFYDQQGTVNAEQIVAVARYCAKELHIRHLFIDSLMKCVKDEDDYNGQKRLVDELTAIARDHDMHIHLVHHIRKLTDEHKMPDKTDVKGSGSITDQVDNLLLLWRNIKKEGERQEGKKVDPNDPDAVLVIAKQRNGEWEGKVGLWFDHESRQFLESPGAQPMMLANFPHRRTE